MFARRHLAFDYSLSTVDKFAVTLLVQLFLRGAGGHQRNSRFWFQGRTCRRYDIRILILLHLSPLVLAHTMVPFRVQELTVLQTAPAPMSIHWSPPLIYWSQP